METSQEIAFNFSAGPFLFIWLLIVLFMIVTMWKVFTKAGKPGWGCIIPFYNLYLMVKIAGKPGWWLILLFLPIVNIIINIIVLVGISNNFGKSGAFAVGLLFLPFIFFPILAFGSARYMVFVE